MDYDEAFVDSLTDGVLADAILIPPRPAIPATKKVRGLQKSKETSNRKTIY